jgi:S-DNA-T family DNA segregation ATPase FtsK/SpoIIIE
LSQKQPRQAWVLAACLFLLGAAALLSLAGYLGGRTGLLSLPGRFLFESYLWPSFFVPVYLLSLAAMLLVRVFPGRRLLVLNLFIVPFLTVTVFQKVVLSGRIPSSWLPRTLIAGLGKTSAALLLLLLVFLEILVIFLLGSRGRPPEAADKRGPEDTQALKSDQAGKKKRGSRNKDLTGEDLLGQERRRPAAGEQENRIPAASLPEAVLEELEAVENPPSAAPSAVPPASLLGYAFPIQGLLQDYADGEYWKIDDDTRHAGEVLMSTLQEFNIAAEVTGIRKGPVITMFEVLPAPGVKISRIVNLSDNIALRLAASRVRIVAPIPGKHAVGIEVPNKKRAIVSFKEMVSLQDFQKSKMEIPIALGKDISGEAHIVDLTQTPHLLIAGATGSGKSVCVNSIICSILYGKSPHEVRFMLIDPKIVELKIYNDIPHLLTPVITDSKRTFQALQYCLLEMERRYSLLDSLGVRDIHSYNRKAGREKLTIPHLPYWVIVIDEFADLMATSGKEMEATLARMAAMARAVGLHLVLATQRPSIDVITGLIKANIPSRVAFMVASKFDSRTILDSVGAEKLLGRGDMLFSAAWDPIPMRLQGAYLAEEEVRAVTDHARSMGEPEYLDEELFFEEEGDSFTGAGGEDPMMDQALEIVLLAGKASASYLQRRLKIGYNRAARIVEEMEMRGIVGPAQGSKPREILHVPDRS